MKLPRIEINKILYATDLAEPAVYAYAWAVSIADRYRADIAILHVMKEFPGEAYFSSMIGSQTWKEIKAQHQLKARDILIGKRREGLVIRDVLQEFSNQAQKDTKEREHSTNEIIIEQGDPANLIVQTAYKKNCDIIVMGSHGYGAVADALIGSTAKQVVRKSTIPVLVIQLPENEI